MKVAYHFACNDISVEYDKYFYKVLFSQLLRLKVPFISSKILIGDLLVWDFLRKGMNEFAFIKSLIPQDVWKRISETNSKRLTKENVFVICFETIQKEVAEKLHTSLLDDPCYLGAFEICDTIELHWWQQMAFHSLF